MNTPLLPQRKLAWFLLIVGAGALFFSLLMQAQMWLVELGFQEVAAGGGEYVVALIFGMPALAVALLTLGTSVAVASLKSQLARCFWWASLAPCVALLLSMLWDVINR